MAGASTRRLRARFLAGTAIAMLAFGQAQSQTATDYYYDTLGRLIAAVDANGKAVGYTYDLAGNRITLSNQVPLDEIRPLTFTASSTAGTTGLTAVNGMRDGAYGATSTIHLANVGANAFVKADFGSIQSLDHVDLAPAAWSSYNATNLNNTTLQWSSDGTTWSTPLTVTGAVANAYVSIPTGGVKVQYVKLVQPSATVPLAIGDFRFYTASTAGNRNPVVDDFPFGVRPGITTNIDITTHMKDPDNNPIRVKSLNTSTLAQHGVPALVDGHTISYTPNAGYLGPDVFNYDVTDDRNGNATGKITVNVHQPPVAQSFTFPTQIPHGSTTQIDVGGYISDPEGLPVNVSGLNAPTTAQGGLPTIASGHVINYTPNNAFGGADTFSYTVTDGLASYGTGTITVNVAQPLAVPQVDVVNANVTSNTTGNVIAPRFIGGGAASSISHGAPDSGGQVTINGLNFIYAPRSGFTGTETFSYYASNATGDSNSSTVSVAVAAPAIQKPQLGPINLTVPFEAPTTLVPLVQLSGNPPTSTHIEAPFNNNPLGQPFIDLDGKTIYYRPYPGNYGSDWFYLSATNSAGTSNVVRADVTITAPGPPTASDYYPPAFDYDVNIEHAITLPVSGYSTGVTVVTQPTHGQAFPVGGKGASWHNFGGFWGDDWFTYKASNDAGASNVATVYFHVNYPPPPTAGNGTLTVAYNTSGTVPLTPGGVYNSPLTVSSPTPNGSTVTVSGTTATYSPKLNSSGDDSFTYTATGPSGASATGTIQVHVSSAALAASIDNNYTTFSRTWNGGGWAGSPTSIHVTASGGVGTLHYSWTAVSNDPSITINGGSTATATWSHAYDSTPTDFMATWRCTVTDDGGNSVVLGPITVTFNQSSSF